MLKYIDEKNSNLARDENTGEAIEATTVIVPIGSKIQTPEQQKAAREWCERQTKRLMRRKLQDELGYFYFVMRQHEFGRLSAESAARLIYLCTYLNYHNEFMLTERTKMKKADLKNVLGLSTGTTHSFWKDVEGTYILDFGKDGLKLISPYIVRGRLGKTEDLYKKFYLEGVRCIYEATATSKHRYLGYIFQLLPYVNTEHNVICKNPDEKDIEQVEPLLIDDICDILGYDKTQRSRFINIYRQLTFEYHGHEEWFVTFVTPQDYSELTKAYVNPHVFFSGSDYHKVETLGLFTKKTPLKPRRSKKIKCGSTNSE